MPRYSSPETGGLAVSSSMPATLAFSRSTVLMRDRRVFDVLRRPQRIHDRHARVAADRKRCLQSAHEGRDHQHQQHDDRQSAECQRTATRPAEQVPHAIFPGQWSKAQHENRVQGSGFRRAAGFMPPCVAAATARREQCKTFRIMRKRAKRRGRNHLEKAQSDQERSNAQAQAPA